MSLHPDKSEPIELSAVGVGSPGDNGSGVGDRAGVRDSVGARTTGSGGSAAGGAHCVRQIAPTIRNASICSSL